MISSVKSLTVYGENTQQQQNTAKDNISNNNLDQSSIERFPLRDAEFVEEKLEFMRKQKIWPNCKRYLWTDAFGLVQYCTLYHQTQNEKYKENAEWLVREVDRVLGRKKGYRIGEEASRDGQYYHYLIMWVYALHCLSSIIPEYHEKAVQIIKDIHPHFLNKPYGLYWKMVEDLSTVYPGFGIGGLDHYKGYVVYRLIDPIALSSEINDLREIVERKYRGFSCTQDLGLGMMLWSSHFFPNEEWSKKIRNEALRQLEDMWVSEDDSRKGYFCRHPMSRNVKFSFTNFGVSLGLQCVNELTDKVTQLNELFKDYQSGTEYDVKAITHVMETTSHNPGMFIDVTKFYEGNELLLIVNNNGELYVNGRGEIYNEYFAIPGMNRSSKEAKFSQFTKLDIPFKVKRIRCLPNSSVLLSTTNDLYTFNDGTLERVKTIPNIKINSSYFDTPIYLVSEDGNCYKSEYHTLDFSIAMVHSNDCKGIKL
ncbi:hypothetical protein ABK040_012029 [Willaertia magna]